MHSSSWTLDRLADHVGLVLEEQLAARQRVIILAFSGGADSTALLLALLTLATRKRQPSVSPLAPAAAARVLDSSFSVVAAHIDHRLDPESGQRAKRAEAIATRLIESAGQGCGPRDAIGSPTEHRFITLSSSSLSSSEIAEDQRNGVEAGARATRYALLERLRQRENASLVLTAHHDQDQLETLLLRIRQGTGVHGLAGIQWRRDALLRPLLGHSGRPGPRASDLRTLLETEQVSWIKDPTNANLRFQRNLIRHRVLPAMVRQNSDSTRLREIGDGAQSDSPDNDRQLALMAADWCWRAQRLATTARSSLSGLDQQLETLLTMDSTTESSSLDFLLWLELPPPVQDAALHSLHRSLGLRYGPTRAARAELRRQIDRLAQRSVNLERCSYAGARIACSCGGGWYWRVDRKPAMNRPRPRLTLGRGLATGQQS